MSGNGGEEFGEMKAQVAHTLEGIREIKETLKDDRLEQKESISHLHTRVNETNKVNMETRADLTKAIGAITTTFAEKLEHTDTAVAVLQTNQKWVKWLWYILIGGIGSLVVKILSHHVD